MFLQSCDVLANEQRSLVDVIEKLDRHLANEQSRQDILLSHLAYVMDDEEEVGIRSCRTNHGSDAIWIRLER